MADVPENALYVWSWRPVKLFLRKAFQLRNRICIPEASTEGPVERVIQVNIHFDLSTAEQVILDKISYTRVLLIPRRSTGV